MIIILTLISLVPVLILVIGSFFILSLDKKKNSKHENFYAIYVILLSFFANSLILVLFFSLNLNQEILNSSHYIFTEIILLFGVIIQVFSTKEKEFIPKRKIFDGIFLVFLSALVGFTVSNSIISIISWFLLALFIIVGIFYFGDFPKDLKLLKRFFIGLGVSVILLSISIFLILIEFRTFILSDFNTSEAPGSTNDVISLCLILGLGIPCGFFPLGSLPLNNYFQESSYSNLFIFSLFSFTNLILIIRLTVLISYSLLISGLLIMIISFLGLLISSISLLSHIFYPSEKKVYSIKKIIGFSQVTDFNIVLFHLSFYLLTSNLANSISYLNFIIIFTTIIFSTKTIFIYSLFPAMLESFDDNLRVLGNFWDNYKIFGIFNFFSGINISIFISFVLLYNSLSIFAIPEIITNSVSSLLASITFSVNVFWLLLSLILISFNFVQMYSKKIPKYTKRERKSFNIKFYSFPVLFIIILIGILYYIYFF